MARPPAPMSLHKILCMLTTTFVATVVIVALYWAQVVFIPLAMALFLSFLLSPLVTTLQRWHLGRVPAVIGVVTFATILLASLIWLIGTQVNSLLAELPKYSDNITAKIRSVQELTQSSGSSGLGKVMGDIKQELEKKPADLPPNERGRGVPGLRQPVVTLEPSAPAWISRLPSFLTPAIELLGGLALAIVLVVFILIKREDLRNRFIRLVGRDRLTSTTKAVDDAAERISRFLLMQLIVNASFGVVLGTGLYLIGVDYALVWGFLAAMLRYIPYVGAWIAAVLPIGLSLAMFQGWGEPLLVIGLFLVLELISNNVMEPWLYGQSTGVSEVALLISAAFWAFLWGPIGMVLSAPMTVCLVVLGRYVPRLRFLDVILGDEPALDLDMGFYQRLLAHDQDESAEIIQKFIKENGPESVYDALLVPALVYLKRDRDRDDLNEKEEQHALTMAKELFETMPLPGEPVAAESSAGARVRILLCPARDLEDELAVGYLQRLLDPAKWEVEAVGEETLTGELISLAEEKKPAVLCIGTLPPGGSAHARYLCKKLRTQFPEMKILVGRWGEKGENSKSEEQLCSVGADHVSTKLLDTRKQLDVWWPVLQESQAPAARSRVA